MNALALLLAIPVAAFAVACAAFAVACLAWTISLLKRSNKGGNFLP